MLILLFLAVPYPEASISYGQYTEKQNERACYKLIYKNGCKETRTGTIESRVTVDDKGKVVKFEVSKNAMRRDPKLVEKCVVKEVNGWVCPAPGDADHTFEMTLRFGDKC